MTVPATSRRAGPYNGNGSTTSFSFSFKTFAAGDLQVTKTGTTGLESVLVLNSDYSITLNGDQDASPGGSITYPISGTALASGEKLTIVGDLDYEQTTDLLGGGAFNARTIEDTFDRTVIQIQQLEERADRSLTLPVSATASTVLPVPAAGKVIAWDSSASALVNVDATDLASTVAYANWRTDRFSGNGSTTAFTLAADPGSVHNMDVSIGGVVQQNGVDFTVSGTTLTFTSAPPSGTHNVLARYGQALPVGTANASNVTFDPAGTGAQIRTVQSKLREWVSPEDFGAAGDGSTNDTTALQNALNTGKNVRGTPGATYYINPLTQNTARQVIDMRGCTLKLRPSQSSYMLSLSGQGAQVLGGVWDGNKAAGQSTTGAYYDHASVFIAADYCVVDGIKSQNSAGIGIKGSSCNYVLVYNCEVTGWNVQGIYIESLSADAFGNRIENNIVTVGLNTGVGIYLTGSNAPFTYKQKRWVISNNIVTGPTNPTATDIGITCRAVDGVVSGNHVINCDLGITSDITSRTTFTGNRVEFTGTPVAGYCYEMNGADNTFSGNIAKGGKYGYVSSSTLSCDGNNLTGNVFELQTIYAVYFTTNGANTANYLTISGNTFNFAGAGASRVAIYFNGDCRYSTITGNNFIGPGSGVSGSRAIYLDTAYGEVQICSNRFQGWFRPVGLYSASAYSYVNVMFNGNDLSKDMIGETAWLNLEGSAAYGNGIRQMWNSSGEGGGYSEINYLDRKTNLQMLWSANGSPEGAVTAAVGSIYMNTAGGAGTVLYVKQSGTGNTGWGAK